MRQKKTEADVYSQRRLRIYANKSEKLHKMNSRGDLDWFEERRFFSLMGLSNL
jgi:hypothetical protein